MSHIKTSILKICLLLACLNCFIASAQNKSIILGRPTDSSITASIIFDQNVEYFIEYGTASGNYTKSSSKFLNSANIPDEIDIVLLLPNTHYFYRLQYRLLNNPNFTASPEYSFTTQRAKGSTFTFTIESDEHLYDKKGYPFYLSNLLKQPSVR